jgi:hypothetical protein
MNIKSEEWEENGIWRSGQAVYFLISKAMKERRIRS